MAGRLRAVVSFVQAVAAGVAVVSVLPAGQARAAGGARPSNGQIESLSCTSAGECAAVGSLGGIPVRFRPLVVSEKNGVWGSVRPVGLGALPGGHLAVVLTTVSCSSAGNCGAGGYYGQPPAFDTRLQGVVVTERHGVWGKATAVPGLAALNTGRYAAVDLMSCRSAGNCTATGSYAARHGDGQGFVVSEKDGTWGKAEPIRGLAAPARDRPRTHCPAARPATAPSPGSIPPGPLVSPGYHRFAGSSLPVPAGIAVFSFAPFGGRCGSSVRRYAARAGQGGRPGPRGSAGDGARLLYQPARSLRPRRYARHSPPDHHWRSLHYQCRCCPARRYPPRSRRAGRGAGSGRLPGIRVCDAQHLLWRLASRPSSGTTSSCARVRSSTPAS